MRRLTQKPRRADIREKPDCRFRHGEIHCRGDDRMAGIEQDARTAAHGQPVSNNKDRLGINSNQKIKTVLGLEIIIAVADISCDHRRD